MARQSDIDQLAINTIRMLAIDAVQKANSGHPGTPMDAAPTAYVLWQRFCAMIRPTPIGSTAIALSFRAATRRCCSTASSI
jgi:Transketolase, thiamine diphosphate binding domain